MTENKKNDKIFPEELLIEFPKDKYKWELYSCNNNNKVYIIKNEENSKDVIYIKELYINNKEKDICKYKQIYKEIYFFIKLKNYNYFSKNVEFKLSKDKKFAFLKTWGDTVSLSKLINSKKYNYLENKSLIKSIVCQIVYGLYILHSNNIIHHDIKPSNIIINENGDISIIDFGSAIFKGEESIGSTLPYAAPEFLINNKQTVDEKYDIWSLGVILLQLYLKKNKFEKNMIKKSEDQLNYNLGKYCIKYKCSVEYLKKELKFNNNFYNDIKFKCNKNILHKIEDKDAIKLIYNLLSFNPKERYSAKDILYKSEYLEEGRKIDVIEIEPIDYPKDYDIITNNINHEKFIELLEKIK